MSDAQRPCYTVRLDFIACRISSGEEQVCRTYKRKLLILQYALDASWPTYWVYLFVQPANCYALHRTRMTLRWHEELHSPLQISLVTLLTQGELN